MLILTENGFIAARDRLGRTPIALARKEGAMRQVQNLQLFQILTTSW